MSTQSQFIQHRLNFAKDLLKSGNIHRAISICEDLLSPASMVSHGKEIFAFIADAVEQSGNVQKAHDIRVRAKELFEDSSDTEFKISTQTAVTAETYLSDILPSLLLPNESEIELIMYDDIFFSYNSIHSISTSVNLPVMHRSDDSKRSLSALEELAKRLEHAKIPVLEEEITLPSPSFMPSIVTETMATIYEQQGAFTQAIKAYQVLARNNPDKLEYYESKIVQLRLRQ